jgi:uncharacterized membrane protein
VGNPVRNASAPEGDSHLRSVAKAFSWRVIATLTTGVIAYLVTGRLDTAALIGGIEFVFKIGIFYLHERVWMWQGSLGR